jgi:hypothetical protein
LAVGNQPQRQAQIDVRRAIRASGFHARLIENFSNEVKQ